MMLSTMNLQEEGVYHSQLDMDGQLPISLFLPQAYEPKYSYPLLIFLHGHGQRETQWMDALPQLSRRNYIGVGLRGPHAVNGRKGRTGYGWGRDRRCDGALEDYVLAAIDEVRETIRIHPGRIFLAGVCEGASLAYRLGLTFPSTFAGVVALNGWLPIGPLPLSFPVNRVRHGDGPSMFIGHGLANAVVPAAKAQEAYQLLYAAGLAVELRMYAASHGLTGPMLRDVDAWVMNCCQV